jgi:hypothetical protein
MKKLLRGKENYEGTKNNNKEPRRKRKMLKIQL